MNLKTTLRQKLAYSSGKAYDSCDTLPLFNFIEIIHTGDIKHLLQWGYVPGLSKIWDKIHSEYVELTKDTKFSATFRMKKEIFVINNRLQILDVIIRRLSLRYVPELCDELRKMGFKMKFTPETMDKDLQMVIVQSKSLILKSKQYEKEIEALSAGEKKTTKQDYYDAIAILEKYRGGAIDPRTTTVMQFVSLSNLFKKQNS